ncbi:MAG: methylenetetrahydromethanopterin dehydrogenase [Betaproteobacteria bacterium]|nr:methylenetetrahydromethanopterin dehydrogenase [Betaproteobacteria bacterium]
MEKSYILHLFTPIPQASPFDVNIAHDAGYNVVVPYTGVGPEAVAELTQDAIFSRGAKGGRRTGIFIGGREVDVALDMMDATRKAMVPPFEVSVFADPGGAFTTAASAIAMIEKHLYFTHNGNLKDKQVLVLGGTGAVGRVATVLAGRLGAKVDLASHTSLDRARHACDVIAQRYGVEANPAFGIGDKLLALVERAEIIVSAARAGVEVLPADAMRHSGALLIAADLNALPPAGIAGVGVMDDGAPLAAALSKKAIGIGALVINNIRYQVGRTLFELMRNASQPCCFDFEDAFAKAREIAKVPH